MDDLSNMEEYNHCFGEEFLPGGGIFHSDWEEGLWTENPQEPIHIEANTVYTDNFQETPLLMNQDPLLAMDPKLLNSVIPSNIDCGDDEGLHHEHQEITVNVEVSNHAAPANGQWTVIAEAAYDSATLNNYDDTTSFTNTSFDSGYEDQTYQGWSYESLRDPASQKYVPETLNMTNTMENAMVEGYLPVSESVTKYKSKDNAKRIKKTGFTTAGEPKRKVGRPKKTYTDVTVVPTRASPKAIEQAKQKRLRELNNIASQKCRARTKQRRIEEEREAEDLVRKNSQMKDEVQSLENAIKRIKQKFIQANLQIPDFPFCSAY